ncbi:MULTISPECIES: hypothetical protein [unclassified Paraburkholderia]|uniref:hypothetical protein n=1 Tax=unclassified Paraburkholderia TaxID=2615204 RepID=UPI00161F5152|nr:MULTISPECIES: hypothetical protein [unclassified Paraburkholderia]MBB5447977.1 hypothetical protein [Paraburkholderia sp. WSM4177]MBB5488412.1 hypothetical protein [Paraburkholderia sp. WSM4180]
MVAWSAEDLLYLRLGTETPNWSLAADDDMLLLAAGHGEKRVGVRLTSVQLEKIRMAKGGLVITAMGVIILGAYFRLYLVGRKVDDHVWKGRASSDANFLHVAQAAEESTAYPSIVVDLVTAP